MRLSTLMTPSPAVEPYWGMVKGLSNPVKLELVALLSGSMVDDDVSEHELTEEERKAGLMSLCGCWADDPEDAARMEAAIKESRENDNVREFNFD